MGDEHNILVYRYFQCAPQHGLFAPIPRVEKIPGEPPAPQAKRSSFSQQMPPLQNAVTSVESTAAVVVPMQSPRGSIGVSPASSMNRLRKTLSSSTIGSVTSESHAALINRQQVNSPYKDNLQYVYFGGIFQQSVCIVFLNIHCNNARYNGCYLQVFKFVLLSRSGMN